MEAVKVSACVDCSTTIIGDRLRCPACQQPYEPRPHDGVAGLFARWMIAAELVVFIVLGLILGVRGCL
jgi:hypothetical protein